MNSNTSQSSLSYFPFPSRDESLHPYSDLNAFILAEPNPVDLVHSSHLGGSPHLWPQTHCTDYKIIPPWSALDAFSSEVPQTHQQPSYKAPSAPTATLTQSHRQTAKQKRTSAQPYHIGDRTRVLPSRKKPSIPWAADKPRPPCCNQDLTVRVPPHHLKSDIHLAYTGRDGVAHFLCAAIYFCNFSNTRVDSTRKHAKKCKHMHQIKNEYSSRLVLRYVLGEPNPDDYQYTVRPEVFAAYLPQTPESSSSQSTISSRRSSPTSTPPPTPVDQEPYQPSYASGSQAQWQAPSSLSNLISIAQPPHALSVTNITQPFLESALYTPALKGFDDNIFDDLPPLSVLDDDDETSFGYLPPSPKLEDIEDLQFDVVGFARHPSADQTSDFLELEGRTASKENNTDNASADMIDNLFRSILLKSGPISVDRLFVEEC